jgi:hypothetical protein
MMLKIRVRLGIAVLTVASPGFSILSALPISDVRYEENRRRYDVRAF